MLMPLLSLVSLPSVYLLLLYACCKNYCHIEFNLSMNNGTYVCPSHSIGNSTTKVEPDDDPSKTELLEALCHSQTRAREAEKAAEQAYADKEHVVALFFKQASQLFAYKQWFQLLQLENLCLQRKNKNQPISGLFPSGLPWFPHRVRQAKKDQHKAGKRRRSKRRSEIRKRAVAFAVGLGLASAGLLLGWTMGWLFPSL